MPQDLESDHSPRSTFKPARRFSAQVDSQPRSILFSDGVDDFGYVLDDHLVQSREGRYVLAGEVVRPCDNGYARTGLKIVVKAFSDPNVAAKEASILKWACTDNECALRLPKLLDVLQDQDTFYLVYEFISGGDLFDRIRLMNGACVPEALAVQWMSDLLHCLEGLHRQGIAHMDLSPEVRRYLKTMWFLRFA